MGPGMGQGYRRILAREQLRHWFPTILERPITTAPSLLDQSRTL